jgi:hypothetical protein
MSALPPKADIAKAKVRGRHRFTEVTIFPWFYREQTTAHKRLFAEGPKRGFLVIAMLQTTEFFLEQIKQCRDSAARSHNKGDHDFWLKMARRWEVLLQIRQPDCAGPKTRYKIRLHHLRFARRRRAA